MKKLNSKAYSFYIKIKLPRGTFCHVFTLRNKKVYLLTYLESYMYCIRISVHLFLLQLFNERIT